MQIQGITGFEWDNGNEAKCQKHGVSIAALQSAFYRTMSTFPDPIHSQGEERFIGIGKTDEERNVFVAFTKLRHHDGDTFIRPIRARYMHKKEVEYYEKAITQSNN